VRYTDLYDEYERVLSPYTTTDEYDRYIDCKYVVELHLLEEAISRINDKVFKAGSCRAEQFIIDLKNKTITLDDCIIW
jgi:hypothetical protein